MFNKKKIMQLMGVAMISIFLMSSCKPNDAAIAEAVKSKVTALAQGLTVDVKEGVVTLSGTVADDATKAAVESALAGIKGVKSVVNNMSVPPPPPPPVQINPDEVLKTTIQAAFTTQGITGITATVDSGVVTLTGDVKKTDLQKVMQVANESKPKKVNNRMKIIK
jgi:hyperosmotically inducible periplasmic protein